MDVSTPTDFLLDEYVPSHHSNEETSQNNQEEEEEKAQEETINDPSQLESISDSSENFGNQQNVSSSTSNKKVHLLLSSVSIPKEKMLPSPAYAPAIPKSAVERLPTGAASKDWLQQLRSNLSYSSSLSNEFDADNRPVMVSSVRGSFRVIRMYISSTYVDTVAERQLLSSKIFPLLNSKLRNYEIQLMPVELRWGAVDPSVPVGVKVLIQAIKEIDRCRFHKDECPWFISLLTDRIGAIESKLPVIADFDSRKPVEWLGSLQGTPRLSLQMIEIMHAFLSAPRSTIHKRPHAFQFRRNAGFMLQVPNNLRWVFQCEHVSNEVGYMGILGDADLAIRDRDIIVDAVEKSELCVTTYYECSYDPSKIVVPTEIDHSKYLPSWGMVQELGGFEDIVTEQLFGAISGEISAPRGPKPLSWSGLTSSLATIQHQRGEAKDPSSGGPGVVGRSQILEELRKVSTSDQSMPVVVLWGPAGCGKSAILAQFWKEKPHGLSIIIWHEVQKSQKKYSLLLSLLRHIIAALIAAVPDVANEASNLGNTEMMTKWTELAAKTGRRITLIVDNAEDLVSGNTEETGLSSWIPAVLPPNLKIILGFRSSLDPLGANEQFFKGLSVPTCLSISELESKKGELLMQYLLKLHNAWIPGLNWSVQNVAATPEDNETFLTLMQRRQHNSIRWLYTAAITLKLAIRMERGESRGGVDFDYTGLVGKIIVPSTGMLCRQILELAELDHGREIMHAMSGFIHLANRDGSGILESELFAGLRGHKWVIRPLDSPAVVLTTMSDFYCSADGRIKISHWEMEEQIELRYCLSRLSKKSIEIHKELSHLFASLAKGLYPQPRHAIDAVRHAIYACDWAFLISLLHDLTLAPESIQFDINRAIALAIQCVEKHGVDIEALLTTLEKECGHDLVKGVLALVSAARLGVKKETISSVFCNMEKTLNFGTAFRILQIFMQSNTQFGTLQLPLLQHHVAKMYGPDAFLSASTTLLSVSSQYTHGFEVVEAAFQSVVLGLFEGVEKYSRKTCDYFRALLARNWQRGEASLEKEWGELRTAFSNIGIAEQKQQQYWELIRLCQQNYNGICHAATQGNELAALLLIFGKEEHPDTITDGRTPLQLATENGHIDVLTALLTSRATVDLPTDNHWNPLHFAAYFGQPEAAELLLQHKANPNAIDREEHRTPLHYAALNGFVAVVKILLQHGANPNLQDTGMRLPSHLAIVQGHNEIVTILANAGALVNDAFGLAIKKYASVHDAAQVGDTIVTIACLVLGKAKANDKDKDGNTPLHWASARGHHELAQRLLEHKADINTKNMFQESSLHLAAQYGHADCVEVLLKNGASIKPIESPIDAVLLEEEVRAKWERSGVACWTDTAWSLWQRQLASLRKERANILGARLKYDADRLAATGKYGEAAEKYQQAIDRYTESQNKSDLYKTGLAFDDVQQKLAVLKKKAEIHQEGRNLFDNAAQALQQGKYKLAMTLYEQAKDSFEKSDDSSSCLLAFSSWDEAKKIYETAEWEQKSCADERKRSPLHWAARNGHLKVAELLLSNGANINAADEDGRTPLSYSILNRKPAMTDMLIKRGAIEGTGISQ